MDCTPLAVVQLRMWGPRRQLAVQPDFCQSRKMQTQCRDGCPDLSVLYHIVCVRHCSRTTDLIPNLTVVLQPIKYLHWFSKYIYILFTVYKTFIWKHFLKILYSIYYFCTTEYWTGSQETWVPLLAFGCVTSGESTHLPDFLMYKARGRNCEVSKIPFSCNAFWFISSRQV